MPIDCMPTPERERRASPIAPADAPQASVVRQGPSLIESAVPELPLLAGMLSGVPGERGRIVASDIAEAGPDSAAEGSSWGMTASWAGWGGGSGGGGYGGTAGGSIGGGGFVGGGYGGGGIDAAAARAAPMADGSAAKPANAAQPPLSIVLLGAPGGLPGGITDAPGDYTPAFVPSPPAAGDPGGATGRDLGNLLDPVGVPPDGSPGAPPTDAGGVPPTDSSAVPPGAAVPSPGTGWLLMLGIAAAARIRSSTPELRKRNS
jgi:hypothetical protein